MEYRFWRGKKYESLDSKCSLHVCATHKEEQINNYVDAHRSSTHYKRWINTTYEGFFVLSRYTPLRQIALWDGPKQGPWNRRRLRTCNIDERPSDQGRGYERTLVSMLSKVVNNVRDLWFKKWWFSTHLSRWSSTGEGIVSSRVARYSIRQVDEVILLCVLECRHRLRLEISTVLTHIQCDVMWVFRKQTTPKVHLYIS